MEKEELPPNSFEEENTTEKNNNIPLDWNTVLKALGQFISGENASKLIDKHLCNKEKLIDKQYKYARTKYWQDIIMVSIILGAILAIIFISKSSTITFINETTIGTLLGGIIGYALARFKNN